MSCKRHCKIGQRGEHCVTPGLISLLATDFSNTDWQEGRAIFKSGNSSHCCCWDSGGVKITKLWDSCDRKDCSDLLVIMSNPPRLCHLELVSWDHVQVCFNITKDTDSSRKPVPVSSHFYSKNVLPRVTCDSGIAMVEEMLHIVKENKIFWAGVPRVWFHSIALEQFMVHWVYIYALSIFSLISDINYFLLSFVHFYWVPGLRVTGARMWMHKHSGSLWLQVPKL